MWNPLKNLWASRELSEAEYHRAQEEILRQAPVPVIWLFGKTGAGKSSIVRYLTGASEIEIGNGFRPQTRSSSQFDFPSESEPLLRFLDTRGLGEVAYDPQVDLDRFGREAHLLVVVVRAMDHAVEQIVIPLREIRRACPTRPVLLVPTALHDAYPGKQHPGADPFGTDPFPIPQSLPDDLRRSLALQYERFQGLIDRAVPIDLTPADEGFVPPDFGGERLKRAIVDALPAAYRQVLLQFDRLKVSHEEMQRGRAMPMILGTSTLAATAAAIPVPWIDIPVVLGLQSHLVYKLANLHRQPIDGKTIAKVSGGLGGRLAVRMAIRESLKFIPWVGMAANAAAAFAYTFAGGMVWNWYFTRVAGGHVPSEEELRNVFRNQLSRAAELWKTTQAESTTDSTSP